MASTWYKKASVQSALVSTLIGAVPAAIIAVASILIQKDLSEKQLKHQLYNDSIQSIEANKESLNSMIRFKSDSLLTVKQIKLNQLQLDLEHQRQRSEILLAKNMEAVNKQALEVSKKQYNINQRDNRERRSNNISKLWLALKDIESFTLEADVQYNLGSAGGVVDWTNKASLLIENLIQNPLLLEHPILLKEWKDQIEQLRAGRWFFVVMDSAETDSTRKLTKNSGGSMVIHDRKSLSELILKTHQFHAKLLQSI